MGEIDSQVCDVRYKDIDRRLGVVEQSIKENLIRIYDKLDAMGQRPSWAVTLIIGFLGSSCTGMATYLLTKG